MMKLKTNVLVISALTLVLSGCIIKLLSGAVVVDDLGKFIQMRFDDVNVAYCSENTDPVSGNKIVECEYSIETEDGFSDRTSTTELISNFGVFGIIIDPVIVQVPDIAEVVTATVDEGSGPQDLIITESTTFNVQPGVQATAEAGHKFWIIDLPPALETNLPEADEPRQELDYQFDYRLPGVFSNTPANFKAMYAGRVELNGEKYYFPMYPCTTDFANVPELSLPVGIPLNGFIFDLLFLFLDNESLTCDNQVYDFTNVDVDPLMCDADLDQDVDRQDITTIFGRRNTPATSNDPLDIDEDGLITVLDARRCSRECTLPRCAVN